MAQYTERRRTGKAKRAQFSTLVFRGLFFVAVIIIVVQHQALLKQQRELEGRDGGGRAHADNAIAGPPTSKHGFVWHRNVTRCMIGQREVSLPSFPDFIIAGAQKSGTTALFNFLSQHSLLRNSDNPETHYFDWTYPGPKHIDEWLIKRNLTMQVHTETELQCAFRLDYAREWRQWDEVARWIGYGSTPDGADANGGGANGASSNDASPPDMATSKYLYFEKTPSYLFHSKVPPRINRIGSLGGATPPKIIFILRNPIDRAYSHYRVSKSASDRSFEDLIDAEVRCMTNVGLVQAPTREEFMDLLSASNPDPNDPTFQRRVCNLRSFTSAHAAAPAANDNGAQDDGDRHLRDAVQKLRDKFAPPQLTRAKTIAAHESVFRRIFANNFLQRSMYATHVRNWIKYFPLHDKMTIVLWEDFRSSPHKVYGRILDFVGVPASLHEYPDSGFDEQHNFNSEYVEPMDAGTRCYLRYWFDAYNRDLSDLMQIGRDDLRWD